MLANPLGQGYYFAPQRRGAIAQLGERLHGMQEVSGSIPLGSTTFDIRPSKVLQLEVFRASPSSRGLGHHPFTVATGVRIPVGTPVSKRTLLPADHPEFHGAIAQLGEHLLCKQGVVGSIPTGSTMFELYTEVPFEEPAHPCAYFLKKHFRVCSSGG